MYRCNQAFPRTHTQGLEPLAVHGTEYNAKFWKNPKSWGTSATPASMRGSKRNHLRAWLSRKMSA